MLRAVGSTDATIGGGKSRKSGRGAGNGKGPNGGGGGATDPYFSNVTCLLHFDGTNGSTTFTDQIATNIWTGNADAQLSTAQKVYGTASLLLDGISDYISKPAPTVGFAFGTDDYTIEGWFRPENITSFMHIIQTGNYDADQISVRMSDSGKLQMFYDGGANPLGVLTTTNSFTATTWSHWAVSRVSGTTRLFIDGTLGASSAAAYNDIGSGTGVRIGARDDTPTLMVNGYLDEIRVTKGVGRYTANFTPPTEAFPNS